MNHAALDWNNYKPEALVAVNEFGPRYLFSGSGDIEYLSAEEVLARYPEAPVKCTCGDPSMNEILCPYTEMRK